MGMNSFNATYSPIFSDIWNFFKVYGEHPLDPADDSAWKKMSDEVDTLAEKHANCGNLNRDMLLACIAEIERLARLKKGGTK